MIVKGICELNVLTFDVGGTFIKWAIIDEQLSFLDSGKIPTPRTNLDDFLDAIHSVVTQNIGRQIKGIAFSLPGTMDTGSGKIVHGGSLRYLDKVDFVNEVSKRFAMKSTIENDARCAAIAEMREGELKDVTNGIAYILGTGVGGAIMIDKKIYQGSNLYAGEFSLMVRNDDKDCKRKSFLGDELSVPGLVSKIQERLSLGGLDGEGMMELVLAGNPIAISEFNAYIEKVVNSLISLQFVFSPEKIVIGGGISRNEYFIDRIKEEYNAFLCNLPIEISVADIARCKFSSDANLLGAFLNFKDKSQVMNKD